MYKLVHIETQEDATIEGATLQHAVGLLFNHLTQKGVAVYSVRLNDTPVLTLSVLKDNEGQWFCEHVVGLHNRQPTAEELAVVEGLLKERGVVLRYNPHTIA